MSFDGVLSLGDIVIKSGMDFEGVVSQLQRSTRKMLCVEDGLYLRIYEEYGPFPFGLRFEHKHRRFGMTEYIFRYAMGTEQEKSLCIFGRDNAETFCPDFVDDQYTSSEEEILLYESDSPVESPYSDIFSTSTSAGSDIYGDSPPPSPYRTDFDTNTGDVKTQEEEVDVEIDDSVHTINLSHGNSKDQIHEKTFKL